jgi:hypothetical protein
VRPTGRLIVEVFAPIIVEILEVTRGRCVAESLDGPGATSMQLQLSQIEGVLRSIVDISGTIVIGERAR